MMTPLPLPTRPSCRLTWIEYRPFFMILPISTPVPVEPMPCYAKACPIASTRQVGRRPPPVRQARAMHGTEMHDTDMTAAKVGGKWASTGWLAGQATSRRASGVFLVALQKLDRDALRPADEADPQAGSDRGRLPGKLDALGLDLGRHRVNVLHGQAEMIESLIGRHRRGMAAVAGGDGRDEDVGSAELDVDPPRAANDFPAEDIVEPGRGRLRIRTAQVNVIPGDCRHCRLSHWLVGRRAMPCIGRGRQFSGPVAA